MYTSGRLKKIFPILSRIFKQLNLLVSSFVIFPSFFSNNNNNHQRRLKRFFLMEDLWITGRFWTGSCKHVRERLGTGLALGSTGPHVMYLTSTFQLQLHTTWGNIALCIFPLLSVKKCFYILFLGFFSFFLLKLMFWIKDWNRLKQAENKRYMIGFYHSFYLKKEWNRKK